MFKSIINKFVVINSVWLNNKIWCCRSWLKLAQVMVCSLPTPHYILKQSWLMINKLQQKHLPIDSFVETLPISVINICIKSIFYNDSHSRQWVTGTHFTKIYQLTIQIFKERHFYLKKKPKQWSNQVVILHMSWQLRCHDMCKFVTWSDNQNDNYNKEHFHKLKNPSWKWSQMIHGHVDMWFLCFQSRNPRGRTKSNPGRLPDRHVSRKAFNLILWRGWKNVLILYRI